MDILIKSAGIKDNPKVQVEDISETINVYENKLNNLQKKLFKTENENEELKKEVLTLQVKLSTIEEINLKLINSRETSALDTAKRQLEFGTDYPTDSSKENNNTSHLHLTPIKEIKNTSGI